MSSQKILHSFKTLCFLGSFFCTGISIAETHHCQENIRLQVLGSGGPEINDGLASASYLIWINNKATIMIDAGGGSSYNFEKSKAKFNDIQAILLSHLHVDHSAALPVYIKAAYFTQRQKNLWVFGPNSGGSFPSTQNFVLALFSDQSNSAYAYLSDTVRQQDSTEFLIKARNVTPQDKVWHYQLSNDLNIAAINVIHGPVPALAWRINYKYCSITFSGDMNGRSGNLEKLAEKTDLLVANNAIPNNTPANAQFLHMTPNTISKIAQRAQVKKLLLSHFMLRTINRKSQAINAIKKNYSGEVWLAKDLMNIIL